MRISDWSADVCSSDLLYMGDDEQEYGTVHIIGIDPNDPQGLIDYLGDKALDSLQGTGTVDHIAFTATDLAAMRANLEARGLEFRERTVPALGDRNSVG